MTRVQFLIYCNIYYCSDTGYNHVMWSGPSSFKQGALLSVEYNIFSLYRTQFVHVLMFVLFVFQGSKVQTRVGLLMLLCTWISNCPIAVTHFLHNQENVPFVSFKHLTTHLSFPPQLLSESDHSFTNKPFYSVFTLLLSFSTFKATEQSESQSLSVKRAKKKTYSQWGRELEMGFSSILLNPNPFYSLIECIEVICLEGKEGIKNLLFFLN